MTRAIVLPVLGGLLTISTPLRAQSGNAEQTRSCVAAASGRRWRPIQAVSPNREVREHPDFIRRRVTNERSQCVLARND
jgi:hypothetical protein